MTATRELITASADSSRLSIRGRAVPAWVLLLVGYVASRILTTGILLLAFAFATGIGSDVSLARTDHGFLGFFQSWDGLHYAHIALHGYPVKLPINSVGDVQRNSWAFLPLFPYLTRAVMLIPGVSFSVAGILIAVVFGAAATLALHRMLLPRFGSVGALWGALFFAFGPMSYLLEVSYADSVFLFLMFCSLAAMSARRWLLMIPFAVLASFAHPGAIALALAIGLVCLARLIRRDPAFFIREKLAAATAIVVIIAAGLAWPVIAGVVTHDPSAYFDTETAWWTGYIGHTNFIPFTPWFIFADVSWGWAGIAFVVLLLAAYVIWLTRPSMRVMGDDLLAYSGSYIAYLVAVFLPQQSIIRMLLPLSPLLGHPALSSSRRRRVITLGVSILLQPIAIVLFWVVYPP
jgi:hypothetical protein